MLVDGEEDCAVFFLGDKTVFMQDHDKDIDIQVTWSNQHKGAPLTDYEKVYGGGVEGHYSCKFWGQLFDDLESVPQEEMPAILRKQPILNMDGKNKRGSFQLIVKGYLTRVCLSYNLSTKVARLDVDK